MRAFVVLGLVFFLYQAKRLAWRNVTEVICVVSSGTWNHNSVSQSIVLCVTGGHRDAGRGLGRGALEHWTSRHSACQVVRRSGTETAAAALRQPAGQAHSASSPATRLAAYTRRRQNSLMQHVTAAITVDSVICHLPMRDTRRRVKILHSNNSNFLYV